MRRSLAIFSMMLLLPLTASAHRPDGDTPAENNRIIYQYYPHKVLRAPGPDLKENKTVHIGGRHSAEHYVPKPHPKPAAKVKPGTNEAGNPPS